MPHDFMCEVGNWVVLLAPNQRLWRHCVVRYCEEFEFSVDQCNVTLGQTAELLHALTVKQQESIADNETTTGYVVQYPTPLISYPIPVRSCAACLW
jgi:hypothetical protein